jgi:hypothetical protein
LPPTDTVAAPLPSAAGAAITPPPRKARVMLYGDGHDTNEDLAMKSPRSAPPEDIPDSKPGSVSEEEQVREYTRRHPALPMTSDDPEPDRPPRIRDLYRDL